MKKSQSQMVVGMIGKLGKLGKLGKQFALSMSLLFWSVAAFAAGQITSSQSLVDAANSANGDNSATGMAIKLFGKVMTDPLGMNTDATMLGALFGIINGSLMVIGTVWVSYSLASGAIATAHAGEFLGGKVSKMLPVRLVAGIGSLVPIKGGYCLAQFIMMAAIQLGIGMGNLTWNAAVDFIASGNALVTTHAIKGNDLTMKVFNSNLCVSALNAAIGVMNAAHQTSYAPYGMTVTNNPGGYSKTYQYGQSGGKECGSFSSPDVYNHKANGMSQGGNIASPLVGINNDVISIAESSATTLYANQFEALNTSVQKITDTYSASFSKFIADGSQPLPVFPVTELDAAATAYETGLTSGILGVQQTLNSRSSGGNFIAALQQDATQNGFINAGAWYMTLGTSNSIAQDALSKSVSIASLPLPPNNPVFAGINVYYAKIYNTASLALKLSTKASINTAAADSGGSTEGVIWTALKSEVCNSAANLSHSTNGGSLSLGQCIIDGMISDSTAAPAIVRISSIGNGITALGAAIITVVGATQGAESGIVGTVVEKAAGLFSAGVVDAGIGVMHIWFEIAKTIAETLFFWGIIASVWIPMVPAVIWIGGVASLMAVWVEAVVAAPIWAFAHMDTDGEGVGHRAQTGYLFILNVLFRPSLMVVGFMLGTIMVDILTSYVLALYPSIIANANVDSWTGLIKILGYISAFVIILQTIVSLSFSMIRYVPDQVLGWIGGNSTNQVGASTENEVGGAATGAFAMRGAASGAADATGQAARMKKDKAGQAESATTQANQRTQDMEIGASRHKDMMSVMGGSGDGGNMAGVQEVGNKGAGSRTS